MTGPVLLAVRPEQVSVTAGPAGVTGDGVTADVVEVSYFGHDATLRARVRDGELGRDRPGPGGGASRPPAPPSASGSPATCWPSRARRRR